MTLDTRSESRHTEKTLTPCKYHPHSADLEVAVAVFGAGDGAVDVCGGAAGVDGGMVGADVGALGAGGGALDADFATVGV